MSIKFVFDKKFKNSLSQKDFIKTVGKKVISAKACPDKNLKIYYSEREEKFVEIFKSYPEEFVLFEIKGVLSRLEKHYGEKITSFSEEFLNSVNFSFKQNSFANDLLISCVSNDLILATKLDLREESSLVFSLANISQKDFPDEFWGTLKERIKETTFTTVSLKELLFQDPRVSYVITGLALLRNYPRGEVEDIFLVLLDNSRVLSKNYSFPNTFEIANSLLLQEEFPESLDSELSNYISSLFSKTPLDKILNYVSGLLPSEFRILKDKIVDSEYPLKPSELKEIRATFKVFPDNEFYELNKICHNIKKLQVDIIDSFEDWVNFFEETCIPLLNSEEEMTSAQRKVYFLANEKFADWLYNNFSDFYANQKYLTLYEIKRIFDETSNKYSILLILDGLSYKDKSVLEEVLYKVGFSITESSKPTIAWIPTLTNISRKVLVYCLPPFGVYDKYEKEVFKGKGNHGVYLNGTPKDFFKCLKKGDRKRYIFIYRYHDKTQHSDIIPEEVGGSIIKSHLESVLKHILRGIESNPCLSNDLYNVELIITSDHGMICGAKNLPKARIPKDIGIRFDKEQHRVGYLYNITKTLENKLDLIKKTWFILDGEKFGLPIQPHHPVWLAPKKVQRVSSYKPTRIHGGISLEECIVPLISARPTGKIETWEPLKAALEIESLLEKNKETKIIVRITNPNSYDVSDATITIHQSKHKNAILYGKNIRKGIILTGTHPYTFTIIPDEFGRIQVTGFISYKILRQRYKQDDIDKSKPINVKGTEKDRLGERKLDIFNDFR